MEGSVGYAFSLTLFAGLSTGLGAIFVLMSKRFGLRLLAFGLGFSSGVMVYISLVELLPHGTEVMSEDLGDAMGKWVALACFFGGIAVSAIIDRLVPEPVNPHEVTSEADIQSICCEASDSAPLVRSATERAALQRVGLVSALAVALHNLPEGMATFATALAEPSLGLSVAIAVAIHNIPEGIAVAVPVYFATGSRFKAVAWSFASGLAEPLGALLVFLILMPWLSGTLVGGMLAAVAGVMVFISFDELLPTARAYDQGHAEIAGVVLGMAVMGISLLLLG